MKSQRRQPYVWCSWLSKVMSGEVTCEWQSWFKAHWQGYAKAPQSFDQSKWMQEHTDLLRDISAKLRADGYEVSVESQNKFHYRTKDGVLIGCNPDIIAVKGDVAEIWDAKTGSQKASDVVQVMLYQLMAPYACPVLEGFAGTVIGTVAYKSGITSLTPTVDDTFIQRVRTCCGIFSSSGAPRKAPGSDCHFCDISAADCPERVEQAADPEDAKGGIL